MAEEQTGDQGFWAEEFDLSALSYSQFLAFFFDRPIVSDNESYDLFRSGVDYFVASDPAVVVAYLHSMCSDLAELTKVYSHEQLDQGLWAVFGPAINCEQFLFDPGVELQARIDCVKSMVLPFRDVVAKSSFDRQESFFFMWWDMILHTFWLEGYRAADDKYTALPDHGKQIADAMFETLLEILALDHIACQWSALHGLGHLHHPLGRKAVQRYLDAHRAKFSEKDIDWIESCAAGQIA